MSESDAVDALRLPFYSSRHPTRSNGWGNQFDLGNPDFYLLLHLVRCAECGYLMGCRANRRQTANRDGKVYQYELDPPRRYYNCYGMLNEGVSCRKHPYIRAEQLEGVVWGEVKKLLENPGLIVASIEAMNSQAGGGGLAEDIAKAERDLQKVQMEEDRAIRLYVSGKITEK